MKIIYQQIKQTLLSNLAALEFWQKKAASALEQAPEGSLILSKSNGSTQYYHKTRTEQKKGTYIEKKNSKLIIDLAQKDYNRRLLKEINRQISLLNQIIKLLPSSDLTDVYSAFPESRKNLVTPNFITDEDFARRWQEVKYEGKSVPEELPFFVTEKGEKVRSKTEKILADKLLLMKIPYRYESPLYLKGYGTIYPDFTLLHVSKREEIYWEHFGMMDNPQYVQKAIQKIHTYGRNGFYPGKNLIITFETLQTPLDMRWVEDMIREKTEVLSNPFPNFRALDG